MSLEVTGTIVPFLSQVAICPLLSLAFVLVTPVSIPASHSALSVCPSYKVTSLLHREGPTSVAHWNLVSKQSNIH